LFKLKAYNVNGSTQSEPVGFVLADIPAKPPSEPSSDLAISSTSQIKIDVQTCSNDGGTPILSYSLEVDDGKGGEFTVLFGEISDTLATTYTYRYVNRSLIYRTRYRVKNAIGWSDYSPIGYLRAAMRPLAPPSPEFISATANSIKVKLMRSEDNGGAEISAYELWIDGGEIISQFS